MNIRVINLGEGGRSNKWIVNSIIYTLEQLKNHPRENIFVIGMLSSIDRQDLIVDKTSNEVQTDLDFEEFADPIFFTEKFSYRQYKWYNQRLENINIYDRDRKTGLLSLTNIDRNVESGYFFEKFAGLYYMYFHSNLLAFESTLTNILSLQSYCKLNECRYLIMTWQDIFYNTSYHPFFMVGQSFDPNDPTRVSLCDYRTMARRIDMYPEMRYLFNQIDFTEWWFNSTDRCETGGLADWCIENGPGLFGTTEDFIHPTASGNRKFAAQVLVPIICQKTGWGRP